MAAPIAPHRIKFRRTAPLAAALICLDPQAAQSASESASARISVSIPALVQVTDMRDVTPRLTPGEESMIRQQLCIQHNSAAPYRMQLQPSSGDFSLKNTSGERLSYSASLETAAAPSRSKSCPNGTMRTLAVKFRADDTGRAIAGVYTGALTVVVVAE